MGMTIEEQIKQLDDWKKDFYCENDTNDINFKRLKSIKNTLFKYQKIQEIIQNTSITDGSNDYAIAFIDIRKVIEDGKVD